MYYLNKDGSLENGSEKICENNPIEIISVSTNEITGESETKYDLVEPHMNNCKCMKCFVKNKIGPNITCNNVIMVVIFLIFMYLVYIVLLKLFY